jgi:hypothetical protein
MTRCLNRANSRIQLAPPPFHAIASRRDAQTTPLERPSAAGKLLAPERSMTLTSRADHKRVIDEIRAAALLN